MKPFILYDNAFNENATASATASGDYDPAHVSDLRAYTTWKASSGGVHSLYADAGASVAVDTLVLFGHNFGSAGKSITLESSTTGSWAGEQVTRIASTAISNDKATCFTFTQATARYWRLTISSTVDAAEIAIVQLGARLAFPVYPDTPFTPYTQKTKNTINKSSSGHMLAATTYFSELTIRAKFTYPPMSFIDGDFMTFWEDHGRELRPFFWVPNYDEWPSKCYFVRLSANYSLKVPQSDTTNADSLDLKLEGIAE